MSTMSPPLRKLALTAHVVCSVGWLGAVAVSVALAITALTSRYAQTVRAVYLAMEPLGWSVLVPLSVACLVTGLVLSLGTQWGLVRHYWVLITLLINILATVVLLLYMQTLSYLAAIATQADPGSAELGVLTGPSALVHASGALVLLLVAATLSVYKPRAMTRYGQRKQREQRRILSAGRGPVPAS